jgi:hypothetical protein
MTAIVPFKRETYAQVIAAFADLAGDPPLTPAMTDQ